LSPGAREGTGRRETLGTRLRKIFHGNVAGSGKGIGED